MKRILISSLLILGASFAVGAGAERAIKDIHAKFEAAMNRNNFDEARKVVRANFSKDFVAKDGNMKYNLDQFCEDIAPPSGKVSSFHFDVGKVTEKGDTATLTVTVHFKGVTKGANGKPTTNSGTETEKEVWKKIGESWKMVSMETVHRTK